MDIHLSTLKDVTSELQKRSTKPSSVPLVLQGEWSHFLPLTLIDTPGIPLDEYSEPSDAMDIILPLIRYFYTFRLFLFPERESTLIFLFLLRSNNDNC